MTVVFSVDSICMLSTLIDIVLQADVWVFEVVNHYLTTSLLDTVMVAVTTTRNWYLVWAIGLVWLVWRGGVRGRWCAGTLVLCIALLDPLSNHLLKETIDRLRPYEVLPHVRQLVGSGGGSFPSNHALNTTAAATVLSAYYPQRTIVFGAIAVLVAYSRVYCGVHWPSDVLGGMVLGLMLGGGLVLLTRRLVGRPAR